ncbi:MAG: enoyl-CoA hydratase [Hahellaceae bacterium]|nr:enoyl-CoA hydratase [Hahellaceae bacterium]
MTNEILQSINNEILTITINRPKKKNALTASMYNQLTAALFGAEGNPQVNCVILTGANDCFSAGNDLMDLMETATDNFEQSAIGQFLDMLCHFTKPVIVAIEGYAIGIGVTMLLHCDLVVAAEDANFQLPFVNLGLCPEAASSLLLPKLIGPHKAAEWLMLGEPFSATEALEAGLINRIVRSGNALNEAISMAERLLDQPSNALRLTKQLLKRHQAQQVEEVMRIEATLFFDRLNSTEAEEALQAFMEKRQTNFRITRNSQI